MARPKKFNKEKERISLYLRSDKISQARTTAQKMGVSLSFIIEDILSVFLESFHDDFEDGDKDPSMEDYYKWKFKKKKEEEDE